MSEWPFLLQLPIELLRQVAERLGEIHWYSLRFFATSCKQCRAASLHVLFQRIVIEAWGHRDLAYQIDSCIRVLMRNRLQPFVRQLRLRGFVAPRGCDEGRLVQFAFWDRHLLPPSSLSRFGSGCSHYKPSEDLSSQQTGPPLCVSLPWLVDPLPLQQERLHQTSRLHFRQDDDAWSEVVDLLLILTGITDLVIHYAGFVSPRILEYLEAYRPRCRLSLLGFRFHDSNKPENTNENDASIATCPNLHRLEVGLTPVHGRATPTRALGYDVDAVLAVAGGLAPNLKELCIYNSLMAVPTSGYVTHQTPWRGFRGVPRRAPAGSLTVLQHRTAIPLRRWAGGCDVTLLRTLELSRGDCTGHNLEWMKSMSFPSLRRIFLDLLVRRRADQDEPDTPLPETVCFFLKSLPPLSEIRIEGEHLSPIVRTLFFRHGPSLETLILDERGPYYGFHFTRSLFGDIDRYCPRLRMLKMPIRRCRSNPNETAIYRALGRIRTLEEVNLTFACEGRPLASFCTDADLLRGPASFWDEHQDNHIPVHWDDFERKPCASCPIFVSREGQAGGVLRYGHLRDILANCAIDAKLMRSIWHVIAGDRRRCLTRPGTRGALKVLEVTRNRLGDEDVFENVPEWSMFRTIVTSMPRHWVLQRTVRDDDPVAVRVQDIPSRPSSADLDSSFRSLYQALPAIQATNDQGPGTVATTMGSLWLEEERTGCAHFPLNVFRHLWPKRSNLTWEEDWSSFPLNHNMRDAE